MIGLSYLSAPRYSILSLSLVTIAGLFAGTALLATDFETEEEIEFKIEEDEGKYSLEAEVRESVTFLTERSTELHLFSIPEPFFAEVSDIHGRYPNGRLHDDQVSYVYHEQEDIFIADNKVWWMEFPKVRKGESIMYGYEMEYEGAEWFPVQYISNMGRTKKFNMKIEHPDDMDVSFSFFFPRDTLPYRIDKSEKGVTILTLENIEEQEDLPYFPFNRFSAAIQTRLMHRGQAVNPASLKEFTAWYKNLFDQRPAIASEHSTEIKAALVGESKPREKLKAIHDYVRQNIRYIAEEDDYGAIVPRNPELVLQRGYGDCKDRAYLIAALAAEEGIDVDMTLVATRPTATFAEGAYIGQFNHVICSWDDGAERVYFDPTSKYTEFENLPMGDIESIALVLDSEEPQMLRLPRPNDNPGIEVDLHGSLENPEEIAAQVTLRNVYFSTALRAINDLRGLDLENLLSNMLTSHFYKISLDYFEVDTVGEDFVRFNAKADLSDFLIASTTKRYIPAMPFRTLEADVLERQEDEWPVATGIQETIEMRMMLDVGGFSIEPKAIEVGDEEHASFASSIDMAEDGTALVTYRLWQSSGLYERESKGRFLEFCQDFLKSKKQMFILSSSE